MSWHVHGQVAGPAGVADLEPVNGAAPRGAAEKAQLAEAKKIAAALLKAKRAGAKGPFLVSLAGHATTGKREPPPHVTVSVARDNSV